MIYYEFPSLTSCWFSTVINPNTHSHDDILKILHLVDSVVTYRMPPSGELAIVIPITKG